MSDDIGKYCLPDFSKCGPAVSDLGPNAKEGIDHCLSFAWTDMAETGTKTWHQSPVYACWSNLPLCLGACCLPCCSCAVFTRNMEKITAKSCESECLSCCVLGMCCYIELCYYAKKRGEFRKKYDLKGTPCFDCLGMCCCGGCMLCQDANELQAIGDYRVPYCSLEAAAKASESASKYAPAKDAAAKDDKAKPLNPGADAKEGAAAAAAK